MYWWIPEHGQELLHPASVVLICCSLHRVLCGNNNFPQLQIHCTAVAVIKWLPVICFENHVEVWNDGRKDLLKSSCGVNRHSDSILYLTFTINRIRNKTLCDFSSFQLRNIIFLKIQYKA